MQDSVYNWLLGGADVNVGLRLFLDFCKPSTTSARIISKNPTRHLQVIKLALLKAADIPLNTGIVFSSHAHPETSKDKSRSIIRTRWAFLSDPDCPHELKILVSDKITAYRNCVEQYDKMLQATTSEQLLQAVRSLVTNFIENHEIFKELEYYKAHKKVLGKHPIFEQMNRIKQFRKLKTLELIKLKENLEHKIWRNKANIKKGDRPDLDDSRKAKIRQYEMELAEVLRLLE